MSIASTGVSDWEKRAGRAAYSVAETAQMLGLCEASIYRAMRRGDIASVMVGGRRIIPAATIDGLLKPQPDAARAA
jgi:excisionase family DNA binding protein